MLAFTSYTFGVALALLFVAYLVMPALWLALMAIDDPSDQTESGLSFVASTNPFRVDAEPANMAKLILLRQRIQSSSRKRRSSSVSRQRSYPIIPVARQKKNPSWARFVGRSYTAKTYH